MCSGKTSNSLFAKESWLVGEESWSTKKKREEAVSGFIYMFIYHLYGSYFVVIEVKYGLGLLMKRIHDGVYILGL